MTVLLLASTGGHLAQLHQLRPRLVAEGRPVVWCTFDTPQSRSLLAGEQIVYVDYMAPRDWRTGARNARRARRVLREHGVTELFSTGSGIALSFLPVARALGVACTYIESAARSEGPSLTGRVAAAVPGVRTFTQYDAWASARWPRSVSVFDDYELAPGRPTPLRKVVVTLGTIEGYGFRALLERLLEVLPDGVDVLWQTGTTDVTGLPIDGRPSMPQAELSAAIAQADAVVAHAGIGSALGALQAGRVPVLVPRRRSRAEHVDDHQIQIARELDARGLALHRELPQLGLDDLLQAAGRRVRQRPETGGPVVA